VSCRSRTDGVRTAAVSIDQVDPMLGTCSLPDLARRKSFKWRTHPPDVLPAFVAEMDFDVAEPIAEAIRAAVALSDTGYAHVGELGEAFAGFAAGRMGWQVDPAMVFSIPDVMTGIAEVLLGTTPHGSGVVINPPVYGPYFLRLGYIGRQVVPAPLRPVPGSSTGYELDFDVLDAALARGDVSAYLLCSPHNPLGKVWSRDDLMTIADICQRRQVRLLVDEIHAPLVLPGTQFVAFGSLDHEMAERAFIFNSASKGWNLAGLKCGVAVAGSPEIADLLNERWEALLAGHHGVLASIAAFRQSLPWLDAAVGQIAENQAVLAKALNEQLPQVRYTPGSASFLAWLDCRELGAGDDPAELFLTRGKVALTSGPFFGAEGAGFARLNIGTSPELITEAVRRMSVAARASG
jgi:cysteine-S-conjugate beta-lyase